MTFFPPKHSETYQHCSPECQSTLRKHQKVHSVKSVLDGASHVPVQNKIIWTDDEMHRNCSSNHGGQPLMECDRALPA